MEYVFIILGLTIVILILVFIVKFVITPLFRPKLSADETFAFLKNKNYRFIEIKKPNNTELNKNHFNKQKENYFKYTSSLKAEYKLVAYSESENIYKLFWIEITIWLYLIKSFTEFLVGEKIENRRVIKYFEETDSEILTEIQNTYKNKITIVTNKCPACNSKIESKDKLCNSCGLIIK